MSQPFQAFYWDGSYVSRPPQPLEEDTAPSQTTESTKTAQRESRVIEPVSEAEAKYAKALAALEISLEFISLTMRAKRRADLGISIVLSTNEKRRLDAEIQIAIDQLKSGPAEGETARMVAENLVNDVGDELNTNLIERGVKFDLADGHKKTLGKWKKEKEEYEEWKLNSEGRKSVAGEDGVEIPAAKSLREAYEREVKHINPRLNTVEYMTNTMKRLWRESGFAESGGSLEKQESLQS